MNIFVCILKNEIRLKHTKKELQSKVAELKKTEATYRKDQEVYKKAEKVLEKLKQELNKINYRGRIALYSLSIEIVLLQILHFKILFFLMSLCGLRKFSDLCDNLGLFFRCNFSDKCPNLLKKFRTFKNFFGKIYEQTILQVYLINC